MLPRIWDVRDVRESGGRVRPPTIRTITCVERADRPADLAQDLWTEAANLQRDLQIRLAVIGANVAGAALVGVEITLVGLPSSSLSTARSVRDNLISGVVLVVYLVGAIVVENATSRRRLDQSFGWVGQRRTPDPGEVKAVFDYSWIQARRIFGLWLGGALLFVGVNLGFGNNVAFCLRVGLGIVLGGLTSSAVSFLLLERYNRPNLALALEAGRVRPAGRLGLQRRLLFTWALGAAVPVILIVSAPAGLSTAQRADLAVPLVIVGLIALAVGFVLTVLASRSVTQPIDALRRSQKRVEDGDLDIAVRVDDGGEVGLLQAGFNQMVSGLRERQRIRDLFGRHVGTEVARHALSEESMLGGELREASVLFVDLIGSTAMTQRLPAQEVVSLLNEFFSAVVHCAGQAGGWVNKFEGDGALCVFGPPGQLENHAAEALRAARGLRAELDGLAGRHPGFDAGIGVSTGSVVAGNIGAENRYEYTIIGDPVNEAARLSDEAKEDPARVLASGPAVEASGPEAVNWCRGSPRRLRGRDRPTMLYRPAGPLWADAHDDSRSAQTD